jgi:hypothetical protein
VPVILCQALQSTISHVPDHDAMCTHDPTRSRSSGFLKLDRGHGRKEDEIRGACEQLLLPDSDQRIAINIFGVQREEERGGRRDGTGDVGMKSGLALRAWT